MSITDETIAVYPIEVETDLSKLQTFNFYLVKVADTLLLIDAGYDNEVCWNSLQHTLKENGYSLTDLEAILLTHHHHDHAGLVNRIVANHPQVRVFAHKDAIVRLRRDPQYLESRIEFFRYLYLQMGCSGAKVAKEIKRLRKFVIDNEKQIVGCNIETISEGDDLYHLKVLEVPGHSLDHVVFYHEQSKSLFAGDHLIEHISSNAIIDIGKNGSRPRSLVMYEQSLQRLFDFAIETAYSGHGKLITEPYRLLEEKLKRINNKANIILQMLTEPQTAASIAQKIYKERYDTLFPLVMSEIIGHIDRLEHYGEITYTVQNNVNIYEKQLRPLL